MRMFPVAMAMTLVLVLSGCKNRSQSEVMAQNPARASGVSSPFNDAHIGEYAGSTNVGKACSVTISRVDGKTVFTSKVPTGTHTIAVEDSAWEKTPTAGTFSFARDIPGGDESIRGNFRDASSDNPSDLLGVTILVNTDTPQYSTPIQENYTCWRLTKTSGQDGMRQIFSDVHVGTYSGFATNGKSCSVEISRANQTTMFKSTLENGSHTIAVPDNAWRTSPGTPGTFSFARDLPGGDESIRGNFRDSDAAQPSDLLGVTILVNTDTAMYETPNQKNYTCWRLKKD